MSDSSALNQTPVRDPPPPVGRLPAVFTGLMRRDILHTAVTETLIAPAQETAGAEGQAMTLEQAIAYALEETAPANAVYGRGE
jgi:hypothetical protein